MTDEAKKALFDAVAEDDRRRYELTVEAVRRGVSYHSAPWAATQTVRGLRDMRERAEAEALRLAGLPEHEWPAETLVVELERQRAENERLRASYDDLSRLHAKATAKPKAEATS